MNNSYQNYCIGLKEFSDILQRKHLRLKNYAASNPNPNPKYLAAENAEIQQLTHIFNSLEPGVEIVDRYCEFHERVIRLKELDPHLGGVNIFYPYPDGNLKNIGLISFNRQEP